MLLRLTYSIPSCSKLAVYNFTNIQCCTYSFPGFYMALIVCRQERFLSANPNIRGKIFDDLFFMDRYYLILKLITTVAWHCCSEPQTNNRLMPAFIFGLIQALYAVFRRVCSMCLICKRLRFFVSRYKCSSTFSLFSCSSLFALPVVSIAAARAGVTQRSPSRSCQKKKTR